MNTTAFPLSWPAGWPRYEKMRKPGKFGTGERVGAGGYRQIRDITLDVAMRRVRDELQKLGVANARDDMVISTNLKLNLSGLPRGDQGEPADPGVAIYWRAKDGTMKVMAVDRYSRVKDNIAAIAATLEAMRAIERHGGGQVLERAFTGFTALPAPRSWRDKLELAGEKITAADVEAAFRRLAKLHHPDMGGDASQMHEIAAARDEALRSIGARA